MHAPQRSALILGATGGVGSATARAMVGAGWAVRALTRRQAPGALPIEWIRGDAMHADDVRRAAEGVDVIVHGVNPPGYRDWETVVLPMMDNTIAAARATGARIVVAGSVYNYGADSWPLVAEDAPQHPPSRKGEIRVAVEARLEEAARHGVRSLIVRCGDFYGPDAGNSWFAQGIVTPGKPLRAIRYPGPPSVQHTWGYLPDIAAVIVALLARETELDTFARFHFAGHVFSGHELADAIRAAANDPSVVLRAFPWWATALVAPFNVTMREVRKMRYLWQHDILLDGRRLHAFLPEWRATPPVEALRATLASLNVLRT